MDILAIGLPGGPEILLIVFLFLVALPFIAIIDLVKGNFKDGTTKLIWLLIIIFAPILGSLIYFAVGRNQKVEPRHFDPFKEKQTQQN